MVRLVKSAFFAFARERVFPAIAFSAVWFIHQGSGLISFVSSLSCLTCQKVLHFSSRDCQVDFVGYGFFWLWRLARSRVIISAGVLAVWSCQQCLVPRPKNIFLVCLFFLPAMRSNTACTRQVGVGAIYKQFAGFEFFLHLKYHPRPPTCGYRLLHLSRIQKINGFYECRVESIRAVREKNSHGSFLATIYS